MASQPWLFVPPAFNETKDVFGGTKNNPKHPCTPFPLGTGPDGETCGSCRHRRRVGHHDQTYQKCGLVQSSWTHGRGSDIKASWLACKKWEPTDAD